MLRSLFSGITGLKAHQNLMDVVSNNISNVNTTGFKSSSMVFEDTLSQLIRGASAPTTATGGINPVQVGLGVQVGGITTNFSQGSAQNTGKSTDLMIQGDGFFIVKYGNESVYSRAGAFNFDSNGLLVNNEGLPVQGWTGTQGVVNTNGPVGNVSLPVGTLITPAATTQVTVGGNITAGGTSTLTLGTTAYDGSGLAHSLTITLVPNTTTTPQSYDITVTEPADASTTPATGNVAFLAADPTTTPPTIGGSPDIASSTDPSFTLADGTVVPISFAAVTQYGGTQSLAVTAANGNAAGDLQQFQIGTDGSLLGVFSNGQKLVMAKLALATFNNPTGLEKMGNTTFRATTNSGLAQVGTPGSGARGLLLGGALEMSNVDLGQEFSSLIIAQRGFQANSRVITTSDQMLQDLVDLKR